MYYKYYWYTYTILWITFKQNVNNLTLPIFEVTWGRRSPSRGWLWCEVHISWSYRFPIMGYKQGMERLWLMMFHARRRNWGIFYRTLCLVKWLIIELYGIDFYVPGLKWKLLRPPSYFVHHRWKYGFEVGRNKNFIKIYCEKMKKSFKKCNFEHFIV